LFIEPNGDLMLDLPDFVKAWKEKWLK
jgi:hypothetical protein